MKARAHEDSEVEILVAWTQHIAPGDAEEATWDGMFGSNTASQRSYSGWKGKKIQKEVKVQSLNAHSFEGASRLDIEMLQEVGATDHQWKGIQCHIAKNRYKGFKLLVQKAEGKSTGTGIEESAESKSLPTARK